MRRSAITAAIVAAMLVVPIAVFAGHQFNDVPNDHIFHTGITWMADNGITVGCNAEGDEFCPDDNVTRGQMSTFMKRLAENQVVDAATSLDADALAGNAPNSYEGKVAGAEVNEATPAATVRTLISTVTGFEAPQNGGALAVNADVTMIANDPDIAIVWIEVNGGGTCSIGTVPNTAGIWQFLTQPSGFLGTSTTDAVNAGSHRVDLCAITQNGEVNFGAGALTVEWVETQDGTIASVSTGSSPEEIFDDLSSNTFGE